MCVHVCTDVHVAGTRGQGAGSRTLVGTSRTQGWAWDGTAASELPRTGSREQVPREASDPLPASAVPSLCCSRAKGMERHDILAAGASLPGEH